MKLHQKILRLFAPTCEQTRRDFRMAIAEANAHSQDLTATIDRAQLKKMIALNAAAAANSSNK